MSEAKKTVASPDHKAKTLKFQVMKKKKTSVRHPVAHKHPTTPPHLKPQTNQPKQNEKPANENVTDKNASIQTGLKKPDNQKVVNEQEQDQVVNDMEETKDQGVN